VPDPAPYHAQADVFVTPLHTGGGMRVKILDAWLWGMPVVSTPIGAEGIAIRDGENILIAADPGAFARATIRLLTEPDLNARLRAAGRAWVEEQYSWQAVYPQVDAVYAGLIERGQAGRAQLDRG
jgi:glycosyltransferase involved in cell wall biosynthesis